MKVLITGAGGFVGAHLLRALARTPEDVLHGTVYTEAEKNADLVAMTSQLWTVDLIKPDAVRDMLAEVQPDQIFHLAGQAYVPRSFENPWETLENNIRGTLSIVQAVHDLKLPTRILVVSSADIYGVPPNGNAPLNEDAPFNPFSPYSVSKIAQDMLGLQYALSYKLFIVRARPFNHIGPGQNNRFAVPNWASQIAEAEAGLREPVVKVGHLGAVRDFTDVRDVVRAYVLALKSGEAGGVYNVCSGQGYQMHTILDKLISFSTVPIEIRTDADRLRVSDVPVLVGDHSRLSAQTGWQPEIPLDQSLRDVLDEWRQRIRTQQPSAH